ncbi:MAG: AAA family ATPase [Acidobacteria bacterium SCN 69-37]|nr:MAG: AAA family ATPase [Acidobacteria bacterium SCN 69-37]
MSSLFDDDDPSPAIVGTPLSERMRPRQLDDVVGQEMLLGPGGALRQALDRGLLHSLILWGPPGTGKTTLARLMATVAGVDFVAFSAVTSGIKEIKEVIAAAERRRQMTGRRTVLFIDEIHRFNKAQQDAFLPHVEAGTIVLIGATTENPSFEVNSALLSRARVYVLEPLTPDNLIVILRRALTDSARGLGDLHVEADDQALAALAIHANGDARIALNQLEHAVGLLPVRDGRRHLDLASLQGLIARRALRYDKDGEEHYNLISALHKSVRNSDANAAVYWLARMIESGEDPMYLARRLVRMASEDIGNADPRALEVALAAKEAVHFLGLPEANAALAQCTIYLSAAPKSNAVYMAYNAAARDALRDEASPVPLHLRNAPTSLMKGLGYGRDYKYAHDEAEGVAAMSCLPPHLEDRRYYQPTDRGIEARIKDALERARKIRG